jgi:FKBP-type peptidyl-prolyl cis-trans isomerase FkpA
MRGILLFLPVALMAQTPAPKAATPAQPATKAPAKTGTAPASATKAPAKAPTPAPKPAGPPPLVTDEQKEIYALGLTMGRQLGQFDLSAAELEVFTRAIKDSLAGKPAIELNEWGPKIGTLVVARQGRVAEREKAAGTAYLAKCATEPGAVKTESGLVYREIKPGTGPSPTATDTVKVHYRGTLVNGTEFDSSYKRNEPTQFPLNQVIKCWTEGVQKMKVGGKSQLVCPADIAYGDQGRPGIPGGATLVFEIELLEIAGAK